MNKSTLRKLITITLMASVVLLSLNAEIMIGTGFISHKATIDESERINFKTINSNYNSIESINYIGPTLDVSYIPFAKVPIGIELSSEILFPIGYNDTNVFRSYHADFKNRNMIGLTYAQSFSQNFGMFAGTGYEYYIYRIASTNYRNSREPFEYNYLTNHSCYGELGLLTTIEHGYFKFGVNYSHSVINKASSFDLIFAGGFKF